MVRARDCPGIGVILPSLAGVYADSLEGCPAMSTCVVFGVKSLHGQILRSSVMTQLPNLLGVVSVSRPNSSIVRVIQCLLQMR